MEETIAKFSKWFNSQSRILQLILLIIPFVNWIVELGVRLATYFEKKDTTSLVLFVLAVIPFTGMILGWIDFFSCLLAGHMFLYNK